MMSPRFTDCPRCDELGIDIVNGRYECRVCGATGPAIPIGSLHRQLLDDVRFQVSLLEVKAFEDEDYDAIPGIRRAHDLVSTRMAAA